MKRSDLVKILHHLPSAQFFPDLKPTDGGYNMPVENHRYKRMTDRKSHFRAKKYFKNPVTYDTMNEVTKGREENPALFPKRLEVLNTLSTQIVLCVRCQGYKEQAS